MLYGWVCNRQSVLSLLLSWPRLHSAPRRFSYAWTLMLDTGIAAKKGSDRPGLSQFLALLFNMLISIRPGAMYFNMKAPEPTFQATSQNGSVHARYFT